MNRQHTQFIAAIGLILFLGCTSDSHKSKRGEAIADIHSLVLAVQMYHMDTGTYPTRERGLDILLSPTISTESPYLNSGTDTDDPWSHRYRYRIENDLPVIDSAGPDGRFDTADDITKDSKLYRKRFGCTYSE